MKIDRNSIVLSLIGVFAAMAIIATAYESCAPGYEEWSRSQSHVMTEEEVRQANERKAQTALEIEESRQRLAGSRKFDVDKITLLKQLDHHPPPAKLSDPPYIKGKVVTFGSNFIYVDGEEIAYNIDDVQTIVRIDCKKARLLGQYDFYHPFPEANTKTPTGRKVPVYSNKCLVTIIDYSIPAVIARKSFENMDAPDEKDFTNEAVGREYVCPEPRAEIAAFIKNLVRE